MTAYGANHGPEGERRLGVSPADSFLVHPIGLIGTNGGPGVLSGSRPRYVSARHVAVRCQPTSPAGTRDGWAAGPRLFSR